MILRKLNLLLPVQAKMFMADRVTGKISMFEGSVPTVPRQGGGGQRHVFCTVLVMLLNFFQLYLSYPHVTNLFL